MVGEGERYLVPVHLLDGEVTKGGQAIVEGSLGRAAVCKIRVARVREGKVADAKAVKHSQGFKGSIDGVPALHANQ